MQDPMMKTMRILWAALLSAQLGFAAVAVLHAPIEHPAHDVVFIAIAIVSLLSGVASFVVPPMTYRTAARSVDIAVHDAPTAAQQLSLDAGFRTAAPVERVFVNAREARRAAYRCATTPFILALALSESVGVQGLAASLSGAPTVFAAPFFAVSALLIALRFPTEAKVISDFEKARGARITG